MAFAGMNYLAILIAALAGFAFGAAYYISISKYWLAAIGKTKRWHPLARRAAHSGCYHRRDGYVSEVQ